MNAIEYNSVKTLLVDPNHTVRQLLNSALWSVGVRNVTQCKHVDEIHKILDKQQQEVDLVILSADGDRDEALTTVRNIRNDRLGINPFLVIMAHTWHPTMSVAQPALDSGTDDLIAAPLSAQTLIDRIGNLVRNRKKFVVTTSYIGPERRNVDRVAPDDLPAIKVPNTLRYKAINDVRAMATEATIGRALHTVNSHRVYRVATLLGNETLKLEEMKTRRPERPVSRRKLRQIAVLAAMVKEQIDTKRLAQLSVIGRSLSNVMDAVLNTSAPTRRDLEILRLHGQAIAAAILEREEAPTLLAGALRQAADLVQTETA